MSQQISPLHDQSGPLMMVNFSSVRLTAAQFERLCRDNPDLRLELTATGELIVMPPAGSKTGARNFRLNGQLSIWVNESRSGIGFDSSTGFTLPNGSKRAPDSAWVRLERWQALTEEEQEGFAPLCPDFVVELRSPTDSLSRLQDKMAEYIANGAQMAWLIDPWSGEFISIRSGGTVEILEDPKTVSGDSVLAGFSLNTCELW